jgi:SAM-dependent methyltransferase
LKEENSFAQRRFLYQLMIFPNRLIEGLIKGLALFRSAYCKIVWAGPNELFYTKTQHIERLEWLEENLEGRTLEVGCSTGYVTEKLKIDVGLDLDKRRLRRAKWLRPDHNFVCSDGSRLPFRADQFDTVILSEVLEHVPFEVAQEIVSDACRVGKRVLITIPKLPRYLDNPEHLWIPTSEAVLRRLIGDRDHVVTRSPNEDYFWAELLMSEG